MTTTSKSVASERHGSVRGAVTGTFAAVVLMLARPAAAGDAPRMLLHLRGSVGPSAIVVTGRGSAQVTSPTRQARGSFGYGYAGGGVSLEVAAGFSRGDMTHELIAAFDWYRGPHFSSDTEQLERMNVELTPHARTIFFGYGLGWPLARGSIWRIALGGGLAVIRLDLEARGAVLEREHATGSFAGMIAIGPRWSLSRTGPHPQSAVTLGLRARLLAGAGLESAHVSPALLGEIAFQ